ncbi:siderophore-interacting protein [Corynebacterium pacaense]|uniref:siderophore-interacting protein n=1 Tax=Corynebacterium pacaense TaxID=1816684 RepID=UPI0009BA94D6|nr:siderophore-interacting protein [Corynebacterium pacaense]
MSTAPYGPVRARVLGVDRLSPSFIRITFGGPDMARVGARTAVFDQRIKLIFPSPCAELPAIAGSGDWYNDWLALPEGSRGAMRTYSIRFLEMDDHSTELTVDFVLHMEPGLSGPAANWAAAAGVGDEILIVAPLRGAESAGGIEFDRGSAESIVLAGDETAAPAIARILEDLHGETVSGAAFIEVPTAADILDIDAPAGVDVRWLPRSGAAHGEALTPAVLSHLGTRLDDAPVPAADTADGLLWETPHFSGAGESIVPDTTLSGAYYWIAGESGVVTRLRRALVRDHGLHRSQVAFMGYWKLGVAMRG